jgi:hypothetical protein
MVLNKVPQIPIPPIRQINSLLSRCWQLKAFILKYNIKHFLQNVDKKFYEKKLSDRLTLDRFIIKEKIRIDGKMNN